MKWWKDCLRKAGADGKSNYMEKTSCTFRGQMGFSLAEVLLALTIGAMVLVAVLGIYSRSQAGTEAITRRFDSSRLPREILQRIAEDLDRIIVSGFGTKITIENKFEKGSPSARLTILKTIFNAKNEVQTFEKIVWQTNYDVETNSLVLYRSYSGIGSEDKLLDEKRSDWEKEFTFVPVCTGITYFKIQVPVGENFQEKWTSDTLPNGVVVTISFAEPFKTLAGTLDVPDAQKITRSIAIDRTRKINFIIVEKKEVEEPNL